MCPDWIKLAGVPEHLFRLLLFTEQDDEGRGLPIKFSTTVITMGT